MGGMLGLALPGGAENRFPATGSQDCTDSATLGTWYPIEVASNKVFLEGNINGSRPLRFILDTGAPSGFVDDALVDELKLTPLRSARGTGSAGPGEVVVTRLKPSACQAAAGGVLPDANISALKLSQISSVEGLRVDGLVGGDFFSRHVVEVDYLQKKIRMLPPTFEYRGKGTIIPFSLEAGHIFVYATVQNASGQVIEGKFMIDTGFRTAISFTGPFAAQHHLIDSVPAIPQATMGIGAGGESRATIFRLPSLQLAGVQWRDIVATASLDRGGLLSRSDLAGVIGGDLLRRYRLILDYPHGRLILEPTRISNAPFEYDKSGIFLVTDPGEYRRVRVLRVLPGSPAEFSGLQANDVLLSIAGKRADVLGLDQVRKKLLVTGQTYWITVQRQGETFRRFLHTEVLLGNGGTAKHRAAAEGYALGADNVHLFYRRIGSGDFVVFLHGGPGASMHDGGDDLQPIADRHTLLMYDQRGGGRSDIITDRSLLTASYHVRDLEALRQNLGIEKFSIVGLSWGSGLAALYASEHPDRVSRIVFLAPMPPARTPYLQQRVEKTNSFLTPSEIVRVREITALYPSASDDEAKVLCREQFRIIDKPYLSSRMSDEEFDDEICDVPPAAIRNFWAVNAAVFQSLGDYDFRPKLATLGIPMLVIEGENSTVPLDATKEWARASPNSQLLLIPDAGHGVFRDQPKLLIEAIERFLEER